MKALLLAAGLASATAIAATAQPAGRPPEAQTPEAQTPEAQTDEQSRVVCVTSTEIGSRLRQRRVCRTRAQWAEYRDGIRAKVTRIQLTGEAPGE